MGLMTAGVGVDLFSLGFLHYREIDPYNSTLGKTDYVEERRAISWFQAVMLGGSVCALDGEIMSGWQVDTPHRRQEHLKQRGFSVKNLNYQSQEARLT